MGNVEALKGSAESLLSFGATRGPPTLNFFFPPFPTVHVPEGGAGEGSDPRRSAWDAECHKIEGEWSRNACLSVFTVATCTCTCRARLAQRPKCLLPRTS